MLTSLIVSFRETLEMLVVLVPLIIYLYKVKKVNLAKYLFIGSGVGILSSIFTGIFVLGQAKLMSKSAQSIFEGAMFIILSAFLIYGIAWMGRLNKGLSLSTEGRRDSKLTGLSMFLIAFLTIYRESLEILIFVIPLLLYNPINVILGIILGTLLSISIMFIAFKTSIKLNISIIFNASTLILIFMGSTLFGEGLFQLLPQYGNSIETAGKLIYGIPMLYIFLKRELKKYING